MEFNSKIDVAKARHYQSVFESVDELLTEVSSIEFEDSALGDVEATVDKRGQEILRKIVQGYLNQRSAEEQKQEFVKGEDDKIRAYHRKKCSRKVESLFGEVTVSRIGYHAPELSFVFPLDAGLNLPPNKYSHGLQGEIAYLVATESFDETLESLRRQGGGILPKRQLQEVSSDLVTDFDEFYQQNQAQPIKEDNILVITADCKGVSMHTQDLREATRKEAEKASGKKKMRLQSGEKNGRKRMATVVSVYEVAPFHRTSEQILKLEEESLPPRPKVENKRVWADIVEDTSTLLEQGFEEARRRDPEQKMKWVVLIDGQTELIRQTEQLAKKFAVEVTMTQDLIHVIEYLWKAAHALYPDKDNADKREEWVRKRTHELLKGNAQFVASGLRRAASRAKLEKQERKPVDTAAHYIENNKERLAYDKFLKQGLPIATGVIEGACRYLVKDRMELTGARWRLQSADAVLKLRSLKASGNLEEYLKYHFEQEKVRNYTYCRLVVG